MQRHHDQAGIKNGDVAEQAKRIVLAGGEQNRRKEAAQHSKNSDDKGIKPDSDQEAVAVMSAISRNVGMGPKNSK